MKTIINLSNVTDLSGELPVVTYSNLVTTLVNDPTALPILPIIVPCSNCNSCQCCNACQRCSNCGCGCGCNQGLF